MFTGIIEVMGEIREVTGNGSNRTFWVSSDISGQLQVDQSVSHDGVCLTVDAIKEGQHRVTAIEETLKKTTLGDWKNGDTLNLERCLQLNGRLDGHLVQGHVDAVALCTEKKEKKGSWEFEFEFPKQFAHLVIEKGSISLQGISLTVFGVKKKSFRVAIIPYTFEHTNMYQLVAGSTVNVEFDLIGKYITRLKEIGH
ncbi:MAG TPA: riboflavin synthase [Puia sp.]|nr:riboflavin synthase [Puia sp.]